MIPRSSTRSREPSIYRAAYQPTVKVSGWPSTTAAVQPFFLRLAAANGATAIQRVMTISMDVV